MKRTTSIIIFIWSIYCMSVMAGEREMLQKEWIETNGLGSAISGTVSLANTRKYHALLTGLDEKGRRLTFVNNLEVYIEDESKNKTYLSSNIYPQNIIHPKGIEHVESFKTFPWPTWILAIPQGHKIKREIAFLNNSNKVMVKYTSSDSFKGTIVVRPMLSGRSYFDVKKDYHDLPYNNVSVENNNVSIKLSPILPPIKLVFTGDWQNETYWYDNVKYPKTLSRGEDDSENLWSPGEIKHHLDAQHPFYLIMDVTELNNIINFRSIEEEEFKYRQSLTQKIKTDDEQVRQLAINSEAYLFTRPDGQRSILAGFPWFLDWGRDTFISLEGLLLIKGRIEEAHQILKTFASFEKNGLIPNMFPYFGDTPIYNSVDAPLHFIKGAAKSIEYGNSTTRVIKDLFPAIKNILNNFIDGTLFNISVDSSDGLVWAGHPDEQLTWMDAKVENYVVTPRQGSPVEINALWYNALKVGIKLAQLKTNEDDNISKWKKYLNLIEKNFEKRFYNSQEGYLRDVVNAEDTSDESKIRPNALYALAYAPQLLNHQNAMKALETVEEKLLTKHGLRSLDQENEDYIGIYTGNRYQRDVSYHQGTVWSFLIGVYADAVLQVRGESSSEQIWNHLQSLKLHAFNKSNGHISEIFDGNAPFESKGCFAQAWSDAEFIRIAHRLGKLKFL